MSTKIRKVGDYAHKEPGDVHMERGGPEGALVLFKLKAVKNAQFFKDRKKHRNRRRQYTSRLVCQPFEFCDLPPSLQAHTTSTTRFDIILHHKYK